MTVLGMLRHAETSWSATRRIQGRFDVPLSNTGRQWLRDRRVPQEWCNLRVVSSPLVRCVQTAHCLALEPFDLEPRIVEMSWGAWEGQTLGALRARFGPVMLDNEARGMDFQPTDGESPRQVWDRIRPWLAEIAAAKQPTLAVAHRGVMRVIFAKAINWDLCGRPPAKLDWNCMQLFYLQSDGHPEVLRLNHPLEAVESAAGKP